MDDCSDGGPGGWLGEAAEMGASSLMWVRGAGWMRDAGDGPVVQSAAPGSKALGCAGGGA